MQDRFKFRAWDGQDQEYDYNAQNISFYDHDEDSITLFRHIERDKPNVTLEQCTGLKDKNGKLIYEGDIVKYKLLYEDEFIGDCYKEVSYNKGFFEPFNHIFDSRFIFISIENIEVVGNIHENSELLEG